MIYLIRYNHQLLVLGLANDQLTALDQACHCPATTEEEPRPMGQRLPGPLFLSPPGLFHRVEHWLREKALPYQVRDQRLGKPGDIDRPDWTLLYPLVAQKLKAVLVQNENGVILAPTGSGKSRIVATLLDYIGPTQTGVVIGGSTTETLQLYAELKKLCPYHKFGLRTGVSKTPPERVMVTTVESAAKAVDLTKIDFFIADEAHKSGKRTGLDHLRAIGEQCRYRFGLTAEIRRYDRHEHWLEAHLGHVLIDIPYCEAQREGMVAPMQVWLYDTPTRQEIECGGWNLLILEDLPYQLERTAIFNNEFFNHLVAAVVDQDIGPEEPMLICVEKVKQGEMLQAFLKKRGRHIPLLHSQLPAPVVRELRDNFRSGKIPQLIATKILNTGFNRPDLVYVLNAIGMLRLSDTVQRSGRATRPQKKDGYTNGVVIDFCHNYHPTLQALTQKRIQIYQERGWQILRKPIPETWKKRSFAPLAQTPLWSPKPQG